MKSNSNLLNYISHLMADDEALRKFLVDPITQAEGEFGITKAERAVLRRTLTHLSNKSVNGYTISRHLGSYRRSLRLLQNVLHNVGSKMVQDTCKDPQNQAAAAYTFTVVYNLPNAASGPVDFTCQKNGFVDNNYGGPYAITFPAYTVQLPNPNPTIKEVMDEVNKVYFSSPIMPYSTVTLNGDLYIKSFTPLSTYELTADLSNACYDLSNPNADYVFWFYSINGRANPNTSGGLGISFAEKNLQPGDTVFWQLIAPDSQYGFQPCGITEGNEYASN